MVFKHSQKLKIDFSGADLSADLKLAAVCFLPYNHEYNDGLNFVLPIFTPGGSTDLVSHHSANQPYQPTKYLNHLPQIKKILDLVPAPFFSVRAIKMPPGSGLIEHRDNWRSFQFGIIRLHIPLQTNALVNMNIGGESFHWKTGELWWGDFSMPHFVKNLSLEDRIHLVCDVGLTPELLQLFPDPTQACPSQEEITFYPQFSDRPVAQREVANDITFMMPPDFLVTKARYKEPLPYRISLENRQLQMIDQPENNYRLVEDDDGDFVLIDMGPGMRISVDSSKGTIKLKKRGCLLVHPFTQEISMKNFAVEVPFQFENRQISPAKQQNSISIQK